MGFEIGPPRKGAVTSATFAEPAWGERDHHDLFVTLDAEGATVEPYGYSIVLPRSHATRPVFFSLTPEATPQVKLRFSIYLEKEFALLQRLEGSVKVALPAREEARA